MVLDEQGKPIELKPYDRNVATKIIEDFMLLANETVQNIIFGRRFRLFTGHMNSRMKKRFKSWRFLLIILGTLCTLQTMQFVQKRFKSCLQK